MSMCLRRKLEEFIMTNKSNIEKVLSELKRNALINMEMDIVTEIENLEKTLMMVTPIPSKYTPSEYITALRVHSLILSLATQTALSLKPRELLENKSLIEQLLNLLTTGLGLDLGGIITKGRELVSLLPNGEELFIEAGRKYLVTIITTCGYRDLSEREKSFLAEIIAHKILKSEKPFVTLGELANTVSVDEKKVKEIIKDIQKVHPSILAKENIITTMDKLEDWTSTLAKTNAGEQYLKQLSKLFPEALEKAYYKGIKETINKLDSLLGD